ncbi:MAG: signal recognition particle protein [Alphaproteobacteria bacterium]|nr:signal recognition particle protein [Alphaproteobacteria bacterium]
MFESLTARLGDIFDRLKRRGALSEADVETALREVRVALLEADVALPVVKDFIERVKGDAIGAEVVRSVTPGHMVVKIVHDRLVETLGAASIGLDLAAAAPVVVLIVGLQGSGKTTSAAKIGRMLQERDRKRVLMASLDVYRPAAQTQLAVLGETAGVPTLPVVAGQEPVAIARRAHDAARREGFDVLLLDTAGRLHVDADLMDEAAAIAAATDPTEILLVADSLTGQDAVNVARAFQDRLKLTGIVLTRMDGDGRGGAALSMRAVTGCPIKLIGVGEKIDAIEPFHPERVASRILGMGDVVSLVEKAAATIEEADAARLQAKLESGGFDLDDMAAQLRQLRKMGGVEGVLGFLPGAAKIKKQVADANIDFKILARQEAIIGSMTKRERKNAKLLNARRKQRIAVGSGTSVPEINRLLKQYMEMESMMRKMRKLGKRGFLRNLPFGGPQFPR